MQLFFDLPLNMSNFRDGLTKGEVWAPAFAKGRAVRRHIPVQLLFSGTLLGVNFTLYKRWLRMTTKLLNLLSTFLIMVNTTSSLLSFAAPFLWKGHLWVQQSTIWQDVIILDKLPNFRQKIIAKNDMQVSQQRKNQYCEFGWISTVLHSSASRSAELQKHFRFKTDSLNGNMLFIEWSIF